MTGVEADCYRLLATAYAIGTIGTYYFSSQHRSRRSLADHNSPGAAADLVKGKSLDD